MNLEVWQTLGLQDDFSDVWQSKDLDHSHAEVGKLRGFLVRRAWCDGGRPANRILSKPTLGHFNLREELAKLYEGTKKNTCT